MQVDSLPEDLILFQIITRVPAKSVIRFKCVSKQWNSILMSDRFMEMHSCNLLKDPHLEDHSFLFTSDGEEAFFTIECESPSDNAPCMRPLPQFLASPADYISIKASYHGLVCLRLDMYDYSYYDILLWNPLTTEYKRLPKLAKPDHMHKYCGDGYGLYYSSGEDDYKLLVITKYENFYIYSLKSDSWRKLKKKPPFLDADYWESVICWENNLYFLAQNDDDPCFVRFDTKAERFHKIGIPHENDSTYNPCYATTVHKGSIHLWVKYNTIERRGVLKSMCIELYKFNADGDTWSEVVTYQLRSHIEIRYSTPVHLINERNWLVIDWTDQGTVCREELKKCTEENGGHDEYRFYSGTKGSTQYAKYSETFVSPNKYISSP